MDRGPARLLGLAEDVVGDLMAWSLLLLGVVELLTRLSGS
jgi:hypothetical protein